MKQMKQCIKIAVPVAMEVIRVQMNLAMTKWHAREQGEGQGPLLQKVQMAKRGRLRRSSPRLQP